MLIKTFPAGPLQTNAYAILSAIERQILVIDVPPASAASLADFAREERAQITAVWLTHSHWDHIADIAALREELARSEGIRGKFRLLVHSLDAPNLRHPGSDRIESPLDAPGNRPTEVLQGGDALCFGQLEFQVLHTPGHSPGSICFYCPQEGVLFSGDTLFRAGIGNLALPTAEPRLMASSLQKLMSLPAETRVFPGHGPPTSIDRESERLQGRFGIAKIHREL